ncbi:hypothetical protein T4C_2126 [Trichinella pseudospiralis]|uniref:Uncharacterized protein n=1 Tax=Trichinella pseudospiralis TaxID=6337 RepID=A0A0V1JTF1_TRIPS|nr:hypothetical protein T4C_2126 [Trichinella pseudospiralis]
MRLCKSRRCSRVNVRMPLPVVIIVFDPNYDSMLPKRATGTWFCFSTRTVATSLPIAPNASLSRSVVVECPTVTVTGFGSWFGSQCSDQSFLGWIKDG